MKSPSEWLPAAMSTPAASARISSTRLTICCAEPKLIGRPGMISWSLPKAMFEPQKETEPTIAANSEKTVMYVATPVKPSVRRNSDHEIRNTAPPPTPLNSATICGIAVIFTWRAAGTPTAVPSATPSTIRPQLPSPGFSSVAITAITMPTAAMRLPRTAVVGPESPRRPWMNSANATM